MRFDAYLKDESKVYNIEMQTYMEPKLGKRFRYYQSLMDADLLKVGDDYYELPESYKLIVMLRAETLQSQALIESMAISWDIFVCILKSHKPIM